VAGSMATSGSLSLSAPLNLRPNPDFFRIALSFFFFSPSMLAKSTLALALVGGAEAFTVGCLARQSNTRVAGISMQQNSDPVPEISWG
jgi:hypothetical protein